MKTTTSNKLLMVFAFLVLSIFIASCGNKLPYESKSQASQLESSQQLKKFSSAEEIETYLKQGAVESGTKQYYGGNGGIRTMMATDSAPSMAKSSAESSVSSGGSSSDYSSTNVQVAGVDEADFVKNDGKYIYVITQNKLVITDAYPAENAKIVSETKLESNPRNMLVNKDRLIIFSDDNDESLKIYQYDFVPRPSYEPTTHVYVYDISDRKNPKLAKDYEIDGYYYESRMIGDYVYFISTKNVYYGGPIILPMIRESSKIVARRDVYYFDNPEENYNFNTVASFNVFDDNAKVNAKTFMMGYTGTLYVSEKNMYIAYQKNPPYRYWQMHDEDRFYQVVVPLLPSDVRSKINGAKNDASLSPSEKWDKISSAMEDMYNQIDESAKQDLIEKIETGVEEYETRLQVEQRKTIIHRIGIDNGAIEYGAKGEVPGYLLNQFSMDENDGNLRVATTFEIWAQKPVLYNNVFVLNEGMETIGKLEAIAPDERIYSTRFMGDRLYMVTFKRIDPLFVIDLSNPTNPEVLGELKIPGYSDYLHPYDETHIIGIGKETDSNEWGGISTKGLKFALFDVSDVKNPKPIDTYVIGESGTESEALRDHKAFLFDKEKNLLVIPVSEVKGKPTYDSRLGYYRQKLWQGAYVFTLNENGFEVRGKITHNEGDEQQDWYWYGSPNSVRRSLFMDNTLYTVSLGKIKANNLDDVSEITTVKLPYEKPQDYPYPVPYMAKGSEGVAVASSGSAVAVE